MAKNLKQDHLINYFTSPSKGLLRPCLSIQQNVNLAFVQNLVQSFEYQSNSINWPLEE